jgi:hypothetical protein
LKGQATSPQAPVLGQRVHCSKARTRDGCVYRRQTDLVAAKDVAFRPFGTICKQIHSGGRFPLSVCCAAESCPLGASEV